MGALESGQEQVDSKAGGMSHRATVTGIIMILLGVLAPIMISYMSYMGTYDLSIQSLLWYYHVGPYGFDFLFFPLLLLFSTFPFLILRMVPVLVIYRYYQGKMTRRRAFIGVAAGDLLFLIEGLFILLVSMAFMSYYLIIPTPFQMLIGFLILWRFPVPEPTKPWDDVEKAKPWWEKESAEVQEPTTDKKEEETPW